MMNNNFYQRMYEQELQRKIDFAVSHGFKLEESQGLWRIYQPSLIAERQSVQVAMCTTRPDAARVAYALAAVETARL